MFMYIYIYITFYSIIWLRPSIHRSKLQTSARWLHQLKVALQDPVVRLVLPGLAPVAPVPLVAPLVVGGHGVEVLLVVCLEATPCGMPLFG